MTSNDDPDDVLLNLRSLALLLKKGGRVVWDEAEPRGRKGIDRRQRRTIMLTIDNPALLDEIRWQLYRAGVGQRARRHEEATE